VNVIDLDFCATGMPAAAAACYAKCSMATPGFWAWKQYSMSPDR
jgi:hypothetical protein